MMNVTMTNNDVTDTVGSHLELGVAAGTVSGQGATLNSSITGNIVPASGVGTITITEGSASCPSTSPRRVGLCATASSCRSTRTRRCSRCWAPPSAATARAPALLSTLASTESVSHRTRHQSSSASHRRTNCAGPRTGTGGSSIPRMSSSPLTR